MKLRYIVGDARRQVGLMIVGEARPADRQTCLAIAQPMLGSTVIGHETRVMAHGGVLAHASRAGVLSTPGPAAVIVCHTGLQLSVAAGGVSNSATGGVTHPALDLVRAEPARAGHGLAPIQATMVVRRAGRKGVVATMGVAG